MQRATPHILRSSCTLHPAATLIDKRPQYSSLYHVNLVIQSIFATGHHLKNEKAVLSSAAKEKTYSAAKNTSTSLL